MAALLKVKKAARLAVYDAVTIIVKIHHRPSTTRPEMPLGNLSAPRR
jgi:hypothetical protein